MIPTATFAGRVGADECLHLEAPHAYTRFLRPFVGQRMRLVVSPWREKAFRSLQQNKFYWAVVVDLIAEHCGYTRDEAHEALKFKFLRDVAEPVHGLVRVGSTTQLTPAEFQRYLEDVRIFAATELEVVIPDPQSWSA